jgi:hypothetical protein
MLGRLVGQGRLGEQEGEKRAPRNHLVHVAELVAGMGAVSDRPEAVERGGVLTDEVAVGGPAGAPFLQIQI